MASTKNGPIINFLIKNDLAKSVENANAILLAVAVANIFITVVVLSHTYPIFAGGSSYDTTYRENIPPEVRRTLPPEIINNLPSKNDAHQK